MWINQKQSIHKIAAEDLVNEAASWGQRAAVAQGVVDRTLAGIVANLDAAHAASEVPDAIVEFVAQRVAALRSGSPAGQAEKPKRARR